jgi:ectoine hydroxylase-related dioxygenase (phytanoyl-CoA dioxygenase family)
MKSELKNQWDELGYVVVPGIFDPELVQQLLAACEAILKQWRIENPEDGKPGGGPDATVMRHLNHPGYFASHPEWRQLILESIAHDRVLEVAREILAEEPVFRSTSFFFNPMGSSRDGNWHRDSQFGHQQVDDEKAYLQPRYGKTSGIQMQIALAPTEDIEYVPESHLRWDSAEEFQIRRADEQANNTSNQMPGALRMSQEPGDAALFNPLGMHRGRYHADKTRRTYMLTYMPESLYTADYFSHQPWFQEPGYLEGLRPSTQRFYQRFIDKYKSYWESEKEKLD